MQYFTTYFDKNYLSRGIVLYNSLEENCINFELYVLCLDSETATYFEVNKLIFSKVKVILLADIEALDTHLVTAKNNRNIIEYYFTLSPCLPLYLLKKYQLSHICSLDADILFFSNPTPLFDYLNQYSIIITPHKFSDEISELERFGKYNVSFQIFKNDDIGLSCLETWRKQCIDWCYDTFDELNDRYADQKYLDNWIKLYPNKVKELHDSVSGIAPWNLNHNTFTIKNNQFYSNNEKLIFYHFHHFKIFNKNFASNGFYFYKVKESKIITKLYLTYWNKLDNINLQLNKSKDVIKRSILSQNKSLYSKLLDDGSIYLKLSKKLLFYINLQTNFGRIFKFILKIYA